MEMATLNKDLPKTYKGYDIDELLEKVNNHVKLTDDENLALSEIWDTTYKEIYAKREREYIKKLVECHQRNDTLLFMGPLFIDPGLKSKEKTVYEAIVESRQNLYKRLYHVYEDMKEKGEL